MSSIFSSLDDFIFFAYVSHANCSMPCAIVVQYLRHNMHHLQDAITSTIKNICCYICWKVYCVFIAKHRFLAQLSIQSSYYHFCFVKILFHIFSINRLKWDFRIQIYLNPLLLVAKDHYFQKRPKNCLILLFIMMNSMKLRVFLCCIIVKIYIYNCFFHVFLQSEFLLNTRS